MTDIILYHDEVASSDILLGAPATAVPAVGIPVDAGGGAVRPRQVYYQSVFVPIIIPFAATALGWLSPLSVVPSVARPQAGTAFVPFNTAQLSVNFTNYGWHQALSTPAPVARAQLGYAPFVPYNTAQLSVNFTNFGWHGQPPLAPPIAKAQVGSSFVPYNTAQLSVNFTNFGWHGQPPLAAPVARAQVGYSYVPYNTAQVVVTAYTNFYFQPLSKAVPVAQAQQGYSFVPYNPAPIVTVIPLDMGGVLPQVRTLYAQTTFQPVYVPTAVVTPATEIGVPLDFGASPPRLYRVYYQATFNPPYAPTTAVTDETDPLGDYSLIPLYRRKKHLKDELEEIELKLRDIALDIPLPGHSFPVIYDRPLLEPFSDKQQTISVLVSRRARAQAEYQALLKRQQEDDDDDDDSAVLLLWP